MAPAKQTSETESEPIYFYTLKGPHGVFSQFQKSSFVDPNYPGITFNCAEQYMHHGKAQLFKDTDIATQIIKTTASKTQNALGRKIKNFNDHVWDSNKLAIVERGTYLKFSQNDKLKKVLLETGDRLLVEAAKDDFIWGIGYTAAAAKKVARDQWGQNLLGVALMNVRKQIRAEDEGEDGDDAEEQEDDEEDIPNSSFKKAGKQSLVSKASKKPVNDKGKARAVDEDGNSSEDESSEESDLESDTNDVNHRLNQMLQLGRKRKVQVTPDNEEEVRRKKKARKADDDAILEMMIEKAARDSMIHGISR